MKQETVRWLRLHDARGACKAITQFIDGHRWQDYEQSLLLQSAVERQLEIDGESLHAASTEEPALLSRIPTLRAFVGLRNRIAHGYDTVDHEIVWDTINVDIPDLARSIDDLL